MREPGSAFRGAENLKRGLVTPAVLFYLLAWLAIAIVAATTTFIALRGTSLADWFAVFRKMFEYFYAWAAIALAVYWLVTRKAGRLAGPVAQIPLHAAFLLVLLTLFPFLLSPDNWRAWLYGDRAAGFHALNILVYAFVVIGSLTIDAYRAGRRRDAEAYAARLRELELERSLEKARMEALRAQINPHFLFNTLNSIASLVESSSNQRAYEMIELLADLLRNAFDFSRDKLVTLEEELRFLDCYLAIEKIRYGDRLAVEMAIPGDCLALDVPSLSLQPLVENVIRHAVDRTTSPVTARIAAHRNDQTVTISVADDGPGLRLPLRHGVGLHNVQERLRYLFGDDAALELVPGDDTGAVATMCLPVRRSASQRAARAGRKESAPLANTALAH